MIRNYIWLLVCIKNYASISFLLISFLSSYYLDKLHNLPHLLDGQYSFNLIDL